MLYSSSDPYFLYGFQQVFYFNNPLIYLQFFFDQQKMLTCTVADIVCILKDFLYIHYSDNVCQNRLLIQLIASLTCFIWQMYIFNDDDDDNDRI